MAGSQGWPSIQHEQRIIAELRFELACWHRAAEQVALDFVAVVFAKKLQLLVGFYAFGDDREVQAVGHGDDGASDLGVLFARRKAVDEGAVDLQYVDRELFEVIQRRVACAEIIDSDTQAKVFEAVEDLHGFVDLAHQDAFGQFQLQAGR